MIALNPFGAFFKGAATKAGDAFIDAGTKFFHSDTYDTLSSIKRAIDYGIPESPIKDPRAVAKLFENVENSLGKVEDVVGGLQTVTHLNQVGLADVVEWGMTPSIVKTVGPFVSEQAQNALLLGPDYAKYWEIALKDAATKVGDAASAMQKGAYRFAKVET